MPSALVAVYAKNKFDTVLVTFGEHCAGVVYECKFERGGRPPVAEYPAGVGPRASQREGAREAPEVLALSYSNSGNFLVTGSDDGAATVRPTGTLQHVTERTFARVHGHDGDYGKVVAAALSFDNAFLLTAASTGSSSSRGSRAPTSRSPRASSRRRSRTRACCPRTS